MTTDVSSALETLQLDPDNKQALSALASLHPGNGSGVDRGALAHALTDARRFHRERGDFELCVQLIDLELAWTIEAPKRADLLHEKGRILSDELLRDREGQECVRQALEAVPDHAGSLESQSQMCLVKSNWEPISKRYLQQAESATDPALASSLYLSVAEFQLKYGGETGVREGERFLRKSLELDPKNRRSSQHLERLLRDAGKQDELLDLYGRRAEQASTKEDRAVAELAAGELSEKLGRPDEALAHYNKALESNPVEHRALRAVVASLSAQQSWTELSKILETAARSKRGEQDVALLVELGSSALEAARPGQGGRGDLPPRAQARPGQPRDGRLLSRVLHRPERDPPAGVAAGAGAEDRGRRRPPGRDGDRDGARRRAARGARRSQRRKTARARRTPRRPSTSGRACCACSRTCPRRSSR